MSRVWSTLGKAEMLLAAGVAIFALWHPSFVVIAAGCLLTIKGYIFYEMGSEKG